MKKQGKEPRAEISFSDISPLELWEKLGLTQPILEKKSTGGKASLPRFPDEESRKAFEAFQEDCGAIQRKEPEVTQIPDEDGSLFSWGLVKEEPKVTKISNEKGSLFIWALLKEESKRSDQLSSTNHLFKDEVFETISQKGRDINVGFDEMDFDEICEYLKQKHLIVTEKAAILITRSFAPLFHEKYGARLVF